MTAYHCSFQLYGMVEVEEDDASGIEAAKEVVEEDAIAPLYFFMS